jgi:hypothetical protein
MTCIVIFQLILGELRRRVFYSTSRNLFITNFIYLFIYKLRCQESPTTWVLSQQVLGKLCLICPYHGFHTQHGLSGVTLPLLPSVVPWLTQLQLYLLCSSSSTPRTRLITSYSPLQILMSLALSLLSGPSLSKILL